MVVLVLLILALVVLSVVLLYPQRDKNDPPWMPYWLPWVGNAIEFGRAPLLYIDYARRRLGPTFSVLVAGKRMTFVTDYKDLDTYFHSQQADFQEAVQPFTERTAGVSPSSFVVHHRNVHDAVKGRLAIPNLAYLRQELSCKFFERLLTVGHKDDVDLLSLVRNVMFPCTVDSLFGCGVLPTTEEDLKDFQNTFFKFDEDFEYGAELPHVFVRNWAFCKKKLIDRLSAVATKLYTHKPHKVEKTLLQCVCEAVDELNAPNYALLLLWATQANAVPASYWTLVFVLSNALAHRRLVDEVLAVFPVTRNLVSEPVTENDMKSLVFTKRCVLESIRLTAPGMITRKLTHPLELTSYTVPKGHYLMLSPYWFHRNAVLFPSPETFHPDRWADAELDKHRFLNGFVAFGGGRFQCPGRWFALMEIQLLVAVFVQQYHMKLLDPVPDASMLHLVGTQAPVQKSRVRLKRRDQIH